MPADVLLQAEREKNNKFCGLGRVFGLFMASPDGLMGYGYEIRLHNGKSSGALARPANTSCTDGPRPPLVSGLQGRADCEDCVLEPSERERRADGRDVMGYEW